MTLPNGSKKSDILELLATIRTLRSETGCPWDRRQTTKSLAKYFHEELDELMDAIKNQDYPNICEELGDLLYLIIMTSEINRESKRFHFPDVVRHINQKLIRRHPHVFADKQIKTDAELIKQWQKIKAEEKKKNLFDTDLQ